MTDEIREQISVFIDDELSTEECEFFVRRLQRDAVSRGHYIRYQLIGAAIRGELDLSAKTGELRRRVQLALSGPWPQLKAVPPKPAGLHGLAKPALGIGIAASVAVIAVLGLRISSEVFGIDASAEAPTEASARTANSTLELLSKPSYVVPMQNPEPRFVTPPIQLTKYLMQHSGYASPLNRTTIHLNVVGGGTESVSEQEASAPASADVSGTAAEAVEARE